MCGFSIKNENDMINASKKISNKFDGAILIKGGHLKDSSDDLLYQNGKTTWFRSKKVNNPNTHGTGCTLSSSIACNLADNYSIEESVNRSKIYITNCLKSMLNIGKGSGPINHLIH